MSFIPQILGALAAVGLGFLLGESTMGLIAFAISGLAGGVIALFQPKGAERIYWLFLLVTIVLLGFSLAGMGPSGLVMFLPLVFVLGYFVARLAGRFTGQRNALPH